MPVKLKSGETGGSLFNTLLADNCIDLIIDKRIMGHYMDILENKMQWEEAHRRGWLAKLQAEGVIDWSLYQHPRNETAPGVPGVDLRSAFSIPSHE